MQTRKSVTRGWKKQKPGTHQRTVMYKQCGTKCFLGTKKKFPICTKNTCRINPRGVHSAYMRARQWGYHTVAKRALKLIKSL